MEFTLKLHDIAQQEHQDDDGPVQDKPAGPGIKNVRQPTVHLLPSQKCGGQAPGGVDQGKPQEMDHPPSQRQKLPAFSHDVTFELSAVNFQLSASGFG